MTSKLCISKCGNLWNKKDIVPGWIPSITSRWITVTNPICEEMLGERWIREERQGHCAISSLCFTWPHSKWRPSIKSDWVAGLYEHQHSTESNDKEINQSEGKKIKLVSWSEQYSFGREFQERGHISVHVPKIWIILHSSFDKVMKTAVESPSLISTCIHYWNMRPRQYIVSFCVVSVSDLMWDDKSWHFPSEERKNLQGRNTASYVFMQVADLPSVKAMIWQLFSE